MCRMYASLGPAGPPAAEVLDFRGQCTTGCGGPHGDGWGVVGFADHGQPHILGKAPRAAADDPAFAEAAHRAPRFPLVLAHLRKASVGPKTVDLTQPFTMGRWAFAHNGTIEGGYAAKMGGGGPGVNDSRALFLRLEARLGSEDPLAALRASVREVRDGGFPYTSVTVLLTDGTKLWAARDVHESPDDYALQWTRRDGRLVVAQDPVGAGPWEALPNHHLAVWGRDKVRVEPL